VRVEGEVVELRESLGMRLGMFLGCTAAAGFMAVLVLGGAHREGGRGYDFRTGDGKWLGVLVTLPILLIASEYAWRTFRNPAAVRIDGEGVQVRGLLLRGHRVAWPDLQGLSLGRRTVFGHDLGPITLHTRRGKNRQFTAGSMEVEPAEVLAALQRAWERSGVP
jgi:hypothetical protein